jgi:hypothetical protein
MENKWTSVKDKLPKEAEDVLINYIGWDENNSTIIAWLDTDNNTWEAEVFDGAKMRQKDVTHWMPLPKPPKE